jgi:RimJ/RimL family protein N-acetyltransferase
LRVLETERLLLRWLEASDAGFILELLNDPDWLRYIGDRGVRTVEDARNYIATGPRELYARLGFGLYAVELKESGAGVGICGLIQRDWLQDIDLGFAFLPRGRGQGYAYEAASATLDYGRTAFGLTRVAAIVAPDNCASMRLLARLGFRFERMVRSPGETQDVCLMAL